MPTLLSTSTRYLYRRLTRTLTRTDWDAASARLHALHASISAHSDGYTAILHALETHPGVVPTEPFRCRDRAVRAGGNMSVEAARGVRERLRGMVVYLEGEMETLREYEREYGVVGRMGMCDGELDHVVAYTREWAEEGGRGRGEVVERVLREAGRYLVVEEVPIEEWEVVGEGEAEGEAESSGVGRGVGEGGLRRRRVG